MRTILKCFGPALSVLGAVGCSSGADSRPVGPLLPAESESGPPASAESSVGSAVEPAPAGPDSMQTPSAPPTDSEGAPSLPLDEPSAGAAAPAAGPAMGAEGGGEAESEGGDPAEASPDEESAPIEPSVDATGGRGGPTGLSERVSAGGLTYRIDAPEGDTPRGLLVLLHGSTASNYQNFIPLMRTVASRYDLIPVSVLAPNGQGWNEGNQVRAAELLHRLIQEDLFADYNVDRGRILFSGQSSGGGFLGSNFVPAHAQDYRGGAFLQCGAAPPNIAFEPSEETRQSFRLHFEITSGDPIWPEYYAAALERYEAAGMEFTADATKPGGHCQFDQQQVILDHIDFVLGSPAAP